MRPRRIIKISFTDEARLRTLGSVTLTPLKTASLLAGLLICILVAGYLLVLLTPLKTFIPGYFRESQRARTQEALLRVDSLKAAYLRNEAYIANLNMIFNTSRPPEAPDSSVSVLPLSADSLLPPTKQESAFVKRMREREKFNISVVAPMAAEGMLFYPVSEEGIISADSRENRQARIILPEGASVMAVADGTVIASYYDAKARGYSLVLQHDNGFVSRYTSLGVPLVGDSETVSGGQILALPPASSSGHPSEVFVRLWHDTAPLHPYDYISTPHTLSSLQQ